MWVLVLYGFVFGSFDEDVDDIEDYLGEVVFECIECVLGGWKFVVFGKFI